MPALVDLISLIERFAHALGRLAVVSSALGALAVAHALAALTQQSAYDAIAAAAGIVALFSTISFAISLVIRDWGEARIRRRELVEAGWVDESPLPFFVDELEASAARRLGAARRPWRSLIVALGATVLVGSAVALTLAAVAMPGFSGFAELRPAQRVEAFVAEHPAQGTLQQLGIVAVLDRAERAENGLWNVSIDVTRIRDGETRKVEFVPGSSRLVGGNRMSIREVRPMPGVGAARVRVTTRTGGASEERVIEALRPATFGAHTVTVVDGRMAYLGQLGPAVQIEERRSDGTLVRREWLFTQAQGFDERHGQGELAIELLSVEPPVAVVLSVARGPLAATPPFWIGGALVALALFGAAVSARTWRVEGKSGDFVLSTLGWWPLGAEDVAPHVLSAEQRAELRALVARLRASAARGQEQP